MEFAELLFGSGLHATAKFLHTLQAKGAPSLFDCGASERSEVLETTLKTTTNSRAVIFFNRGFWRYGNRCAKSFCRKPFKVCLFLQNKLIYSFLLLRVWGVSGDVDRIKRTRNLTRNLYDRHDITSDYCVAL